MRGIHILRVRKKMRDLLRNPIGLVPILVAVQGSVGLGSCMPALDKAIKDGPIAADSVSVRELCTYSMQVKKKELHWSVCVIGGRAKESLQEEHRYGDVVMMIPTNEIAKEDPASDPALMEIEKKLQPFMGIWNNSSKILREGTVSGGFNSSVKIDRIISKFSRSIPKLSAQGLFYSDRVTLSAVEKNLQLVRMAKSTRGAPWKKTLDLFLDCETVSASGFTKSQEKKNGPGVPGAPARDVRRDEQRKSYQKSNSGISSNPNE